jgi:outer membrane receptor protein involved in Fe transport
VFYDMNTIPLAAIERIEVLRGGASAIYGSDAIAGVINVITRSDWNGLHVEGGAQTTDRLDHHEVDGSVAYGGSAERTRFSLGLSYLFRNELIVRDRDWTRGKLTNVLANPATFYVPGQDPPLVADPDCEKAKASGSSIDAMGFCAFDFTNQTSLIGERDNLSTFGHAEYDLTDHTTAFTEVGYSRMRSNQIAPTFPVLPQVSVPADHIDNPFGTEVFFLGSVVPAERGAYRMPVGDDSLRGVLGVRGDLEDAAHGSFAEDWEWELATTFSMSRYFGYVRETIVENLRDALRQCADPADRSACFNPFYSAYTGKGTPNSDAVIDHLQGDLTWWTDSRLVTGDANLTGSLFELPGGDLGFAIGGQYRHEARVTAGDHDTNELAYGFVNGFTDVRAKRDSGGGYAELRMPVLHGVELQPAARLEHYENVGDAFSPGVGLLLTPSESLGREQTAPALRELRLRGNVSRAFRAPALTEVSPGFATAIAGFNVNGTDQYRAVRFHGNPDLGPEHALSLSGGLEWAPVSELSLTGTYWNYDYTDRITSEDALQIFNADPNDPRVLYDANGNLLGVNVLNVNAASVVTDGLDFGVMVRLELEKVGLTSSEAGAFSFGGEGTYVLRHEIPRAHVADVKLADGTTITPPGCDAKRCDVAGQRNTANFADALPRLRLNLPVSYENGGHALGVIVHFVGPVRNDEKPDPATGKMPEVDAMTTLDLQYAYTAKDFVGAATTLRLGVTNVFDSDPPAVDTVWGFEAQLHDPRGRVVYARLSQDF